MTATTDPAGVGDVHITYDGAPNPPSAGGTYHVVATVTGADRDGTLEATLAIAKAPQTIDFTAGAPAGGSVLAAGGVHSGDTLRLLEGETKEQSWPRELAGSIVTAIGIAAALGVFS